MRILLVEDDAKLAEVVARGLREQGFSVEHAADGPAGLEAILHGEHDAIVLDVLLPGGSGLDVLREARRRGRAAPVLVLTSRGSVEDRVMGLDLGADDYLTKPFDFSELVARLRAITRRPPVPPQQILTLADLELDTIRHAVRRAGRALELTAKEFALLEYLLRRREVVVTRDMILQNVWNTDYNGGSNVVEVYINYLRRKIDHNFTPKLIRTVRGVGYVLRETE